MTTFTPEFQSHAVMPMPHMSAGALGGLLIGCIGVLLPPVMFWGEWEIQTIASGAPLPHIWPKGAWKADLKIFQYSAGLLQRHAVAAH